MHLEVTTVSNVIPELLTPLHSIGLGKTAPYQTQTTPDQTRTTLDQTPTTSGYHCGLITNSTVSQASIAASSSSNEFYSTTLTPNRTSFYSTQPPENPGQYPTNQFNSFPTHYHHSNGFSINSTVSTSPFTDMWHSQPLSNTSHPIPNNAYPTPNNAHAYLTPNKAHAYPTPNGVGTVDLTPMEAQNVLDELSALLDNGVMDTHQY